MWSRHRTTKRDGGSSWTGLAWRGGGGVASGAARRDSTRQSFARPRRSQAFVIPMVSDEDRVTVDGKVRVYETRDRGTSWKALSDGLPQSNAYLTVLRQAFCADGHSPLGLYFGAESGDLFASADGGATWTTLATHLPPILSVRAAH